MRVRSRRQFLRGGLAGAGLALVAGCGIAIPMARKPPRIGVLLALAESPTAELLRQGLAELGYAEGRSLQIDWRADEGRAERLAENAAALVGLGPDVIVAAGIERAVAARRATGTIPIVLTSGTDPVGAGLIESFARPGGNVTGHLESHPQLAGRQLELLRELAPGIAHVTTLEPLEVDRRSDELAVAARTLGLQLRAVKTATPEALEDALARAAGEGTDALLVVHSGFMVLHQARIFAFAARQRVPAMYGRRSYVEAGGLAAYGPDLREHFSRTAEYVDKILKGARPAELPVQQPSRFDFAINLSAARALGLTIPQAVLAQATEVIQ
jgi:putative tryptophan/tyrosine transport system substrate-binding protein